MMQMQELPASPEFADRLRSLTDTGSSLAQDSDKAADLVAHSISRLEIVQGYAGVFLVAFLLTLLATPIMRRLATAHGVIDRPSEARKVHRVPVAYLGGAAVFLGLLGGILFSYAADKVHGLIDFHPTQHLLYGFLRHPVPPSVLLGMTVIMLTGLIDDVVGVSPRVKLGGQLVAAAALAIDDVGVKLAAGVVIPVFRWFGANTTIVNDAPTIVFHIPLPFELFGHGAIPFDVVYWCGTALIGILVLSFCNASNLIDGLDGLLTGTTAISSAGLLIIALGLALVDDGPRDAQRIVLCLALLGACMGFLPHNFNPASIFLGDAGSLLMGFMVCVIILTLGDTGQTPLVAAGLIVYAVPIIDTSLAIVRRKLERKSISAADDQHLHHMLKRALGVKGAVLMLYAMAGSFAALGIAVTFFRGRVAYLLALVLASYIGVTAIKIARRRHVEEQALKNEGMRPIGGK
ncbi:MAG: undecaprenyl/decaprenyl-phosphate alpha-N-acetylglucosaminyl 1-phosphate transferase [Phycisphaerales bacterium]|nr:undecaprenyl/decaprenyl-phosphate alpha-N-acetylglucosaminyl 1-phosphate transferase [Phycisphaerales bacterium]